MRTAPASVRRPRVVHAPCVVSIPGRLSRVAHPGGFGDGAPPAGAWTYSRHSRSCSHLGAALARRRLAEDVHAPPAYSVGTFRWREIQSARSWPIDPAGSAPINVPFP